MKFEKAVSKDVKKKNLLVEAMQDFSLRPPVKVGGCCHGKKEEPVEPPKL